MSKQQHFRFDASDSSQGHFSAGFECSDKLAWEMARGCCRSGTWPVKVYRISPVPIPNPDLDKYERAIRIVLEAARKRGINLFCSGRHLDSAHIKATEAQRY